MYEWTTAAIIGGILALVIFIISYFVGILMPLLLILTVLLSILGSVVLLKGDTKTLDYSLAGMFSGSLGSIISYLQGILLTSLLFSSIAIISVWFVLREDRFTMVLVLYKLYCKLRFKKYEKYKLFSTKLPNKQRRLLELGTGISSQWLGTKLYDYLPEGYYIRWITNDSIGIIRISEVDDLINGNKSSVRSDVTTCYLCDSDQDNLYGNSDLFMASSIQKGQPVFCSTCLSDLQKVLIENTDIEEADIVAMKI